MAGDQVVFAAGEYEVELDGCTVMVHVPHDVAVADMARVAAVFGKGDGDGVSGKGPRDAAA